MLFDNTVLEEDSRVNEESPSQSSQLKNQITPVHQPMPNFSGDRYAGSTFAGILVIILFVIFGLYKMGCIGRD